MQQNFGNFLGKIKITSKIAAFPLKLYETRQYYNKKVVSTRNYYNFYNDTFNSRKIGDISLFQQSDITNNIIETNTETSNYIDNNCLNKLATIIVNPTQSLIDNYLCIPQVSDDYVPGLDSCLTYSIKICDHRCPPICYK